MDTLSLGVYDHIRVGGQEQIAVNPGVYVMNGGDFESSGQGSLVGNGVTIFLAGSFFPTNAGSFGELKLTGNGTVNLRAQTSGPYAGMLIFQKTGGHIVGG